MALFRATRHVDGDVLCKDRFEVSQDNDTNIANLTREDNDGVLERTLYSEVLRRVAKVKW